MGIRTDMAMEIKEGLDYIPEGIDVTEETRDGIKISRITVKDFVGEMHLKKPMGKYITMDMKNIASMLPEERENAAQLVADELKQLIGHIDGGILVAGLGNRAVTPDSIGPKTCDGVFVTRHIKAHIPEAIDSRAATVLSIAPGVLGVTGIESYETIKGIINETHPCLLIAVDALAARNISRIGSSIQLTDTGIAPGAGLGNRREGLNEKSLSVRVVAIGVPTVVYASTIVSDILDEALGQVDAELKEKLISKTEGTSGAELVVSPKDIDILSAYSARLISDAINIAVNPHISKEEIDAYMS